MKKQAAQKNGFTLIELMVSIGIFTVIVITVIGSVYTANASARKVQASETVLNNANFALESIVRTIRTGTIVACADNISLPANTPKDNCNIEGVGAASFIVVHSTLGRDSYIKYYYDGQSILKQEVPIINGAVGSSWGESVALTAPSVSVEEFRFNFVGIAPGSQNQRGASINLSGYAKSNSDTIPFTLQTFVSQRNF